MLDSPYQWNNSVDGVVDAYAAMVYRLALTRVRTVPDAEDVFQEVFLRYFEKERTFENEEHRKAWLIRVTILCSRKFWSAPFRRRTVPLDETLPFEMPEESAVHAALLSLPAKYRRRYISFTLRASPPMKSRKPPAAAPPPSGCSSPGDAPCCGRN